MINIGDKVRTRGILAPVTDVGVVDKICSEHFNVYYGSAWDDFSENWRDENVYWVKFEKPQVLIYGALDGDYQDYFVIPEFDIERVGN